MNWRGSCTVAYAVGWTLMLAQWFFIYTELAWASYATGLPAIVIFVCTIIYNYRRDAS